jgi:hypothetical protein
LGGGQISCAAEEVSRCREKPRARKAARRGTAAPRAARDLSAGVIVVLSGGGFDA